jgi:hypothetical protein
MAGRRRLWLNSTGTRMRYKFKGYIFLFTRADHEGRHIHVYRGNDLLGVYDREAGPVRGLAPYWNKDLRMGVEAFILRLNERGFFH